MSDRALQILIGLLLAGNVACLLLHAQVRAGSAHQVTRASIGALPIEASR